MSFEPLSSVKSLQFTPKTSMVRGYVVHWDVATKMFAVVFLKYISDHVTLWLKILPGIWLPTG